MDKDLFLRAQKSTAAIIILDDGECNTDKVVCANCPIQEKCNGITAEQKKDALWDWMAGL